MPEKNCQKNKNSYWGVKFYVFNDLIKNVIYPQNWWQTSFVKFMSYRIRKNHQKCFRENNLFKKDIQKGDYSMTH